jgi:hypothetical protein
MRRKRSKKKQSSLKSFFITLKERIVMALAIALVSWTIGFLSDMTHKSYAIQQLQVENQDLSWAVDYFRK